MSREGVLGGTMTLMHDEPTLWGTAPGDVRRVTVEVSMHDALKRVRLSVWTANRKEPMTLDAVMPTEQSANYVVGRMMSLVLRADHAGATLARRSLWAFYNALLRDGYDVKLARCGTDPMKKGNR